MDDVVDIDDISSLDVEFDLNTTKTPIIAIAIITVVAIRDMSSLEKCMRIKPASDLLINTTFKLRFIDANCRNKIIRAIAIARFDIRLKFKL